MVKGNSVPVSGGEGIFGMPVIFSPPQPINTTEPKKSRPIHARVKHPQLWSKYGKGRIPVFPTLQSS